ncbi:hypothetical protein LOAG_03925, partial [Loa loa]
VVHSVPILRPVLTMVLVPLPVSGQQLVTIPVPHPLPALALQSVPVARSVAMFMLQLVSISRPSGTTGVSCCVCCHACLRTRSYYTLHHVPMHWSQDEQLP